MLSTQSLTVPRAICWPLAGDDKLIKYWSVAEGKELRKSQGHGAAVYSLAFHPDGTRLASGSVDKTVRIWNVADGKELHKLDGHPDDVYSVAFSLRWQASGIDWLRRQPVLLGCGSGKAALEPEARPGRPRLRTGVEPRWKVPRGGSV